MAFRVDLDRMGESSLICRATANSWEVFAPLQAVDRFKTGLLDGTLPITRFFTHTVLPVVNGKQRAIPTGRPMVSVRICRLRPFTFLPAS